MCEFKSKDFGFYPSHPGGLLKDELKARGIQKEVFSKQIGVDYSILKKILNEKHPITAEIALLIEFTLGISSELWLRMQYQYDLQMAMKSKRILNKVSKIRKDVENKI
jgi:addiction module HigA family antidote